METRDHLGDYLNEMGLVGEGAEIGVATGGFSEVILQSWWGKTLYMVDSWRYREGYHDSCNATDAEQYKRMQLAFQVGRRHRNRGQVLPLESVRAARLFADGQLDFIYLDADHSFAAVCADLEAWYPKVKKGGLLAGHDYYDGQDPEGPYQVHRAVQVVLAHLPVRSTTEQIPSWFAVKD